MVKSCTNPDTPEVIKDNRFGNIETSDELIYVVRTLVNPFWRNLLCCHQISAIIGPLSFHLGGDTQSIHVEMWGPS